RALSSPAWNCSPVSCHPSPILTTFGDMSWGHVRGVSRLCGQAEGEAQGASKTALAPPKTRREVRLVRPAARARILHGKEGVDGSSPSEGFTKVPANRHFVVACSLNVRTHSGHICGMRDARRRL